MSDDTVSIGGYLSVVYILLFFFCIFIVVYFAEPGFPWHTYVTLIIGYYASFGILLLVPIDIAACVIDRRSNAIGNYSPYNSNVETLSGAYDAFFTIILILGSVILVFEEYYNTDGYFTIAGKLWNSFYRMCFDTILGLVAALIILGILLGQHVVGDNVDALKLTAIIVTNTIYEIGLMFLLAYGLVEFPRTLWNCSDLEYYLLVTQMKATSDYKAISDFKINIQEDISRVHYFKEMVNSSNGDEHLKNALAVLQSDCPPEFRSQRKCKADDIKSYVTKTGHITVGGLARLRGDLNVNKDKYKMAQANVQNTQQLAYYLEDLVEAKKSGNRVVHWSLKNMDSTAREYTWHVVTKPILKKIGCVFATLLSFFSFLGVIGSMKGVDPSNSVYYLAVHSDEASAGGITVFVLFTLGYTAYVTMWALFQMRLAGLMELVPYRTSPEGLSFNVRMCARLAAPLAFFYLGWLAEAGLKEGAWTENEAPSLTYWQNTTTLNTTIVAGLPVNTNITTTSLITVSQAISMPSSFSNFYQLQSVGIIKSTFGTLFPVILLILVPLFVTNVFNRFFVYMKMEYLQFGTAIPTEEQLREGKRQLAKYKKIVERGEQRSALKTHILHMNQTGAHSSFFGIFGAGAGGGGGNSNNNSNNGSTLKSLNDIEANEEPRIVEPSPLSGVLEKKGNSTLGMGANWKEMYAEVRSPGVLYFFKDQHTARMHPQPARDASLESIALASTDLRMIMNFNTPLKKGKEMVQLELEMGEEIVKLKFKNVTEQMKWKNLLTQWKDFAMDYADSFIPSTTSSPSLSLPSSSSSSVATATTSASKPVSSSSSSSSSSPHSYPSPFSSVNTTNNNNNNNKQSVVTLDSAVEQDEVISDEDRDSSGGKPLIQSKATYSPFGSNTSTTPTTPTLTTPTPTPTSTSVASAKPKPTSTSSTTSSSTTTPAATPATTSTTSGRATSASASVVVDDDEKPAAMEGWLDKKGHSHILSNDWQRRYCRIDEATCSLVYYKSNGAKDKPQGSIDLREVGDISAYDKAGKADGARINIDAGDKVYKFKANTPGEGDKWIASLNDWKDYFLMQMSK